MPKIFELPQVRNNQPRNGFDLSQRHLFTASVGQLIPILSELCVPGDNFRIDSSVFTRTVTMRRANFARFKEYVDFFFVPLKSIWRFAPDFLVNIENDTSAFVPDYQTNITIFNAPCFQAIDLVNTMCSTQTDYDNRIDDLGFSWTRGANKLLDMLGYGQDFIPRPDATDIFERKAELTDLGLLNLWKPAAYQAIYQNFYRNSDWEHATPLSYNFDYLHSASTQIGANCLSTLGNNKNNVYQQLFQMRYADYAKDLFIGLKPSTQFGDVAIVSSLIDRDQSIYNIDGSIVSRISDLSSSVNGKLRMGTQPYEFVRLQTQFSILDQRRAEALQRWKEIHLSAKKNYKDQVERTYNVNVPDMYADIIDYVGGFTNLVNVQDVTSTAGTDTDSLGDLAGKGIGATSGETINFKAPCHGVFMAIYHVKPIAEYSSFMLDKQNSIISFEDYYNPLFGNIGLEGVRRLQLSQIRKFITSFAPTETHFTNAILGYTARYIEYKTALDKAHGRFASTGDLADWTLTLNPFERLKRQIDTSGDNIKVNFWIDFTTLKAKPSDTDGVFVAQNDTPAITDDSADPFYVAAQFDFKAIRPMDVDGMPY